VNNINNTKIHIINKNMYKNRNHILDTLPEGVELYNNLIFCPFRVAGLTFILPWVALTA
jgi:hypothetical protein